MHVDAGSGPGIDRGPRGNDCYFATSHATTTPEVVSSAPAMVLPVGQVPDELTPGPGPSFEVSGGKLPQVVITGITSHGGELADTSSWDARFETYGLPRVTGPGVQLAGATIVVAAVDGADGWSRSDGLQWLFMDSSHDGIAAMLDEVARSVGVESWTLTADVSIEQGANCVERDYWQATTSTAWKLQGCDFPSFAGMYSLGVTRTGVFTAGPPVVDPSVAAVLAALGGQITQVSVNFDHPVTEQSVVTLTTSAIVAYTQPDEAVIDTLVAGPLQGWTQSQGDGSVLFTGGLGTRWVVGTGNAALAGQGRLVS